MKKGSEDKTKGKEYKKKYRLLPSKLSKMKEKKSKNTKGYYLWIFKFYGFINNILLNYNNDGRFYSSNWMMIWWEGKRKKNKTLSQSNNV